MKVSPKMKKVLAAIESTDSFSFDEIFASTTELSTRLNEPPASRRNPLVPTPDPRTFVPPAMEMQFVASNERVVAIDLEQVNGAIEMLATKGLLERKANIVTIREARFVHEQQNEDLPAVTQIFNSYSQYRYIKTVDFEPFIKNKFQTNEELEEKKDRRKKEFREWLPIIVSVAALLISSAPAWLNIFKPSTPEKVIVYDEQVQRKLVVIEDEVKKLHSLVEALATRYSAKVTSGK